jgi:LmbE family N-acetylglucosaminyl deacetylase
MIPEALCRYSGETVLAVGAHPDDVELGMGGTAAMLARAGARVVFAVACVPCDYQTRVAEARRAAAMLGAELRIVFPGACRRVEDMKTYELVERVDAIARELRPAAVFTHGPADFHKDHLLVFDACRSAQRSEFRDFFCYHPTTCRPAPVDFHPQVYVDITDTLELKLEAVGAHASQFAARGLDTEFLRDMARAQGLLAGARYAEGLELVRMRLDFKPAPRAAAPRDGAESGSAAPVAAIDPRSRPRSARC